MTSLPYLLRAYRIYCEPAVFLQSDFGARIAIVGSLMVSCGLLVRFCWAELKYGRILAVGGRGSKLQLLKVPKNWISMISGPKLVMYALVAGVFRKTVDAV